MPNAGSQKIHNHENNGQKRPKENGFFLEGKQKRKKNTEKDTVR